MNEEKSEVEELDNALFNFPNRKFDFSYSGDRKILADFIINSLGYTKHPSGMVPLDRKEVSDLIFHQSVVPIRKDGCNSLADLICSTFGTPPSGSTEPTVQEDVSVEDIERLVWKYCTPLYEKDIQGHTHTLKGDDLAIAIYNLIHNNQTK